MDEIAATPTRARRFWMFAASFATVYAMIYLGSLIQTQIDLAGVTNASGIGTYRFIESIITPVIEWIKEQNK